MNLAALLWTIREYRERPYSPLKLLTKQGRWEHHRALKIERDKSCLRAIRELGLSLKEPGVGYFAAYGEVFSRHTYFHHPEFVSGGTVVDVGASFGDFSIYTAWTQASEVYAFEPVTDNFEILLSNIGRNNLSHLIHATKCALGSAEGSQDVLIEGFMVRARATASSVPKVVGTDVKTLDSFQLSPNLIKIDVEGAEMAVLQGSLKTIERSHPRLIIETHSKELRKRVDKLLFLIGYRLDYIDNCRRSDGWMNEVSERFYHHVSV